VDDSTKVGVDDFAKFQGAAFGERDGSTRVGEIKVTSQWCHVFDRNSTNRSSHSNSSSNGKWSDRSGFVFVVAALPATLLAFTAHRFLKPTLFLGGFGAAA
jgi:hypothetical protein